MTVEQAIEAWVDAVGDDREPCIALVAGVLALLGLDPEPGDATWRALYVWDPARPWSLPEAVAAWSGGELVATVDGLEHGTWYAVQGWRSLPRPDLGDDGDGHAFLMYVGGGLRIVETSEALGYRDTIRPRYALDDAFAVWRAAPLWWSREVPMSLAEQLFKLLPLKGLADFILKLAWPLAPAWLGDLVSAIVGLVKTLVDELTSDEYKSLPGPDKLAHVVTVARAELDENFDGLPAWSLLPEEARDRILAGIAELVLLIGRASRPKGIVETFDSEHALKTLRTRVR